jgi:hypothetical protein
VRRRRPITFLILGVSLVLLGISIDIQRGLWRGGAYYGFGSSSTLIGVAMAILGALVVLKFAVGIKDEPNEPSDSDP